MQPRVIDETAALTHETFSNYLVSSAAETEELTEVRDEMYRSSIETNDQDAALLAGLQRTRSMDVGRETTLIPSWDQTIQRFQRRWARQLLASFDQ